MNCIFRQKKFKAVTEVSFSPNSFGRLKYEFRINTDYNRTLIEDKLIDEVDMNDDIDIEVGKKVFLEKLQRSILITDTAVMPNGDNVLYIESITDKDDVFEIEKVNYVNNLIERLLLIIELNNNKVMIGSKKDTEVINLKEESSKTNFFLKRLFGIKL